MSKYIHYIISPLFYIGIAFSGRMFTDQGVTDWYPEIIKPSYTPPGSFIGVVWTIIFILSAISLILFINRGKGSKIFWPVIGLFALNGIVNVAWRLILMTAGMIMVIAWRVSKMSSLLLIPYVLWVSFATYLTYDIYTLN
jgi:tryptophan-rich sensory protein